MTQVDWEKMKEGVSITNVEYTEAFSWWDTQSEYTITSGSHVTGTYIDTQQVDGDFEAFTEDSSSPYNPSAYNLGGSTTLLSGTISNLISDDGTYMSFRSYPSGTENSDFVDNNLSDVDDSEDKGTHSKFSAQQSGPDGEMDTLQESNTGGGSGIWISPTGYEDPEGVWYYETRVYDDNSGTFGYTWVPGRSWSDYLVLTHDEITCDTLQYLIRRQNSAIERIEVDIYDGQWLNVYSGEGTWQQWTSLTFTETSVTQMRFRFYNSHTQQRWVIFYETDFMESTSNYELDLEVQWTKVDYDEANEELCIYCGKMGSEELQVDAWIDGKWETVLKELTDGWNNASVSSYLDSSMFTIRFKGTNETSDSIQNIWNIDAVLLHVWSIEQTVNVEFTGSCELDDWDQINWLVDSAWTTGSVDVTMQLYDYSKEMYPTSGDGYLNYVSSFAANTDETKAQTISLNPTNFRSPAGEWKLRIQGIKTTGTSFDFKSDLIELTPQNYQLDMTGTFIIDLSTSPLEYIQSLEIQTRYRAGDSAEKWYLKAYNWETSTYSDIGFNSTVGHTPTTGWDYYAVNLTTVMNSYIHSNGTIKIKFVDQGADSTQTPVDVDFLGVQVKMAGTQFTFENTGGLTVHLVSLWLVNSTDHQHHEINIFINSAATRNYVRYDIDWTTVNYTVKVVTERGNVAVYSEN
jgi:hypothetical protein